MTTIEWDLSRTRWAPGIVLLAVLIAGLIAGCGGSNGDDGSASGESADSAPVPGADAGSPSSEGAGPANGDGDAAASGSAPGACLVLSAIFGSGPPGENPLSSISIGEVQTLLDQLATQGPDVIQADLRIMAVSLVPFFDTLDELGVGSVGDLDDLDSDAQARLGIVSESLRTSEVRLAEDNIGNFIDDEC